MNRILFLLLLLSTTKVDAARWEIDPHYVYTIKHIAAREGFSDTTYVCPAGYPTIGFGHRIYGNTGRITKREAYVLLVRDFDIALSCGRKLGYSGYKLLGVSHAIYCLGYNKVRKIKNFGDDILKYCHYKKNGKYYKSVNLKKQREFEHKLFNYENH